MKPETWINSSKSYEHIGKAKLDLMKVEQERLARRYSALLNEESNQQSPTSPPSPLCSSSILTKSLFSNIE
jgi:hypothetical protein